LASPGRLSAAPFVATLSTNAALFPDGPIIAVIDAETNSVVEYIDVGSLGSKMSIGSVLAVGDTTSSTLTISRSFPIDASFNLVDEVLPLNPSTGLWT
jgi:hypothetical protein